MWPGAARREVADALNQAVWAGAALDAMLVCYHDDADVVAAASRRGLLEAAPRGTASICSDSIMVGDRWRDVEAGRRARCRTVFIDYDYREAKPMPPPDDRAFARRRRRLGARRIAGGTVSRAA
jgi:D-glycero-D-manno-heptose 1,7-bisphosphate phosphatase